MAYDPLEECDFIKTELEKDHVVPVSIPDKINFHEELYSIMHAFGDVKEPLESSIMLMHNILQNQIALLMKKAENVRKHRKGKNISHQDLLYLMRKNKVLLKRLLQFLFVEDAKSHLLSVNKIDDEFLPENGERVSKCLRYLGFIEKFTGDLKLILKDKSIVDHTNMKRLKRKDLMANLMTQEEYQHFYEYTLRISFCHKHTIERFKTWLQQCSCIKVDIKPLALSIIHFLSRETVARIIDKALEIKSRKHEKNAENFTYADNMILELGQDSDMSENSCSIKRSEDCFEMGDLENNLQPSFRNVPGNSFGIKKSKLERSFTEASKENKFHENNNNNNNNNNSSHSLQNINSMSNTSHDSDSMIKCPVSITSRRENVKKKSFAKPKKDTVAISSHLSKKNKSKLDLNSSSENNITSKFSIFEENLNDATGTSEGNCNRDDDSGLKNGCFLNTYVVEKDNSSNTNSKCETNQLSSHFLFHLPDASKNVNKESYFSLNFQDKALSICYDGYKTLVYGSNTATKLTANTEDKVLASSCCIEFIDSDFEDIKTEDSCLKPLINGFDKSINHIQFAAPIKIDSKVHLFPEDPITPEEIQAAFIHYHHPSPMSYLMKTGLSYLLERKTNLVCLAISD